MNLLILYIIGIILIGVGIGFLFGKEIFSYLSPLVEERKGKLSLGRVSFLVAFIIAMRNFWVFGDLSYSIVTLLGTLLAYGGYKKYVRSRYYNEELDLEKDENYEA